MSAVAFVCFVVAAVFAFVVAIGATITTHDAAWAIFFIAAGLAVAHLPAATRRP